MRHPSPCFATVFIGVLAASCACAGDVRIALVDGNLRVAGDEDGNRFFLLQNAASDIIAIGFPGTTVNGAGIVRIPSATIDELRVDLGAGSDNFGLGGLQVANDVIINGAEGADTIIQSNLPISIGRNLIIRLGSGGDGVTFDGLTVGGDIDLADPVGFQLSEFLNTTVAGNVNVAGSSDDDVLFFDDCNVDGLLNITSPAGSSIQINGLTVGELVINLGASEQGVAQISDANVTGDLAISTGDLVDTIDLINMQVGGSASVQAGAGDDFIEGANLNVTQTLLLDGGDGIDTLFDNGITALGGETVINIEIVN